VALAGPGFLGVFAPVMAEAAARGADELLLEHVRQASGPQGSEYLARMGMSAETPDEVQHVGRKAAVLDALHGVAQDGEASSARALNGFFGSKPGPAAASPAAGDAKDLADRVQKLQALLIDPSKAFEAVPPELLAAAPNTTGQAVSTVMRAAQFLHSKAPKDPAFGAPAALKKPWAPSAADLARFYRYVHAVEDPGGTIERMKDGTTVKEHLETLQVVYPAMYADFQQKLAVRLAEWQTPLPYSKKLALSAVLGPAVLGLSPQQVVVIQQSHAKLQAPPPQQGGSKTDGRQKIDAQKNLETQGQRMEAR